MGFIADAFKKWFGPKEEELPDKIREFANEPDANYLRVPISDIMELPDAKIEARLVLDMVGKMLSGYEDVTFICGGFAAFAFGTTNEFGDIDIWCANDQVYSELREYVASNSEWSVSCTKHEDNGLTKFVVQGKNSRGEIVSTYKFDLIDLAARLEYFGVKAPEGVVYSSVEDVLRAFDISWAMIGIDLYTQDFVFHELAISKRPFLNHEKLCVNTGDRLRKYYDRLCDKSPIGSRSVRELGLWLEETVENKIHSMY